MRSAARWAPPSQVDLMGLGEVSTVWCSTWWSASLYLTYSDALAIRTTHSAGASCRISVSLFGLLVAKNLFRVEGVLTVSS